MTNETPKPKNQRRRWVIAAVLSLVVTAVGWRYYPQGDARFVGKWKETWRSRRRILVRRQVVVLHDNGIGATYDESGRLGVTFSWTVTGNAYRVGGPTANKTVNTLVEKFQKYLPPSQRTLTFWKEHRIESVTANVITMSNSSGERTTLERLPE